MSYQRLKHSRYTTYLVLKTKRFGHQDCSLGSPILNFGLKISMEGNEWFLTISESCSNLLITSPSIFFLLSTSVFKSFKAFSLWMETINSFSADSENFCSKVSLSRFSYLSFKSSFAVSPPKSEPFVKKI